MATQSPPARAATVDGGRPSRTGPEAPPNHRPRHCQCHTTRLLQRAPVELRHRQRRPPFSRTAARDCPRRHHRPTLSDTTGRFSPMLPAFCTGHAKNFRCPPPSAPTSSIRSSSFSTSNSNRPLPSPSATTSLATLSGQTSASSGGLFSSSRH